MKKLLAIICCFLHFGFSFSQEGKSQLKRYSYSEFFKILEQEKDSVFKMNDAVVYYNASTDKRYKARSNQTKQDALLKEHETITIDKAIELDNVHFTSTIEIENGISYYHGVLSQFVFKREVTLRNNTSLWVSQCTFMKPFLSSLNKCNIQSFDPSKLGMIYIQNSNFTSFLLVKFCRDNTDFKVDYFLRNNSFVSGENDRFAITLIENDRVVIEGNTIESQEGISINSNSNRVYFNVVNNDFKSDHIQLGWLTSSGRLRFTNNTLSSKIKLRFDELKNVDDIQWSQVKNNSLSFKGYREYIENELNESNFNLSSEQSDKILLQYTDSIRYHNYEAFSSERSLKGQLYNHYKNKFNTDLANEVYIELKNFETQRLEILYHQNPSFKSFFTWKINQFLKVFSAYGTEPARAVIFSMYVIFFFALIYLFFPNSWDSHGRRRIMNRYRFFTKYMNKDAGIHEVYLEEQQEELLESEDFKNYMQSSGKTIPKFFLITAIPLYKWAVSGTKLSASILKRIDIMKGTWSELPKSRRIWKSILLVGAFLVAVLYDIFIKMLNALMLSINTFTTLGFGEIPIKGLPRYLAIIQGFIGWFMLTIFSVSLISQLLN